MAGTKKATAAPDVRATLHNVEILGGRHLKRRILETMIDGSFEKPEIDAGLGCIKPGDRVIEMGAGSGTVGAILTKNIPDVQIMWFEANPNLLPAINELYAHNGLTDRNTVQNKAVVAGKDAPKTIDFFVRKNFLGSRVFAENNEPDVEEVKVKTIQYEKLRKDFRHNVLMMDIEGAELDFLRGADLSDVDLVIIELHRKVYHRPGMQECKRAFADQGFILDEAHSKRSVFTYKKQNRIDAE
ncbi:MAG: FkbM family methyltransferase [Sulfitobacter sp.]|nr:FkbM family methyltransferase [Sulfitobacter sp.]